MTYAQSVTTEFEAVRPRLLAIGYRMLGSMSDAEDAVQDAWLRMESAGPEKIENVAAWLTTVMSRICIDMLRARKARGEDGGDPWLPEPIVTEDDQALDPERATLAADSVGMAMMVVMEALSPPERLAFVLHDMFAVSFDEIAQIVDRKPTAARKLASRARRRVAELAPRQDADVRAQRRVVDAFLQAARAGDFEALLAVLDPDVVFRADAGRVISAAPPEIRGAEAVAAHVRRQGPRFATLCRIAVVNGSIGVAVGPRTRTIGAVGFTIAGGRIVTIDMVLDPDKLQLAR